jgi:hypothetical protein
MGTAMPGPFGVTAADEQAHTATKTLGANRDLPEPKTLGMGRAARSTRHR